MYIKREQKKVKHVCNSIKSTTITVYQDFKRHSYTSDYNVINKETWL